MTAIPAKVAGVREVIMVTPGASPETLLAARLAGVDRVFELGGAQAIGALAYGTETVPRVDKIVGPGNAWVALGEAPGLRRGRHRLDRRPVGGPRSSPTTTREPGVGRRGSDRAGRARHRGARGARHHVAALAARAGRAPSSCASSRICRAARSPSTRCAHHGAAVIVDSLDAAIDYANRFAPEHLELQRRRRARRSRRAARPRARSSSARSPRRPRATTSRARTTCCRPAAQHATRRRSASTTSASARRSSSTTRRGRRARRCDRRARRVRGPRRPRALGAAAREASSATDDDLGPLADRVPEALRGSRRVPRAAAAARASRSSTPTSCRTACPRSFARELAAALAEVALERYPDPRRARLRAVVATQLGVRGRAARVRQRLRRADRACCARRSPARSSIRSRRSSITGSPRSRVAWPIEVPLDAAVRARRGRDPARDRDAPAVASCSSRCRTIRPARCGAAASRSSSRRVTAIIVVVSDEAYVAYAGVTNLAAPRGAPEPRRDAHAVEDRAWRACASASRCRRPRSPAAREGAPAVQPVARSISAPPSSSSRRERVVRRACRRGRRRACAARRRP